jgi:hypothetical protein
VLRSRHSSLPTFVSNWVVHTICKLNNTGTEARKDLPPLIARFASVIEAFLMITGAIESLVICCTCGSSLSESGLL